MWGEVVKELKGQGVYDNTVIIVMADNGRPFPRDKTRMYDSGMKTPFIINWHDYEAHERMARTKDFIYILNSRPQFPNQGPADTVTSPSFRAMAAENDKHKLTPAQYDVFRAPRPGEELFYCKDDSLQLENSMRNKEYTSVYKELKDVLGKWMEMTGDNVPENLTKDWYTRDTGEKIDANFNIRGEMPGESQNADSINSRVKFR